MDIEKHETGLEKENTENSIKNPENIIPDKDNNKDKIKKSEDPKEVSNKQEVQIEKKTSPETKYKIIISDEAVNLKKQDDEEKNKNPIIPISDNKENNVDNKKKLQNVKNIEFGIVKKINFNENSNSKKKFPDKISKNTKNKIVKTQNSAENFNDKSATENQNNIDNIDNEKVDKKPKIKIFNNKKNNDMCTNLLKSAMTNEKELIIMPYAKEKQKKNKTMNTIGNANGVSYPNISIFNGGNNLNTNVNIMNIIRDDDKLQKKGKKSHKSLGLFQKHNPTVAKINLNNNNYYDNDKYLKEMLGKPENTQ